MPDPIDFYFEFASPYGYLASLQIDAIAAGHGREVAWRPIMLGAALKATGSQPNVRVPLKGSYLLRDVARFARLLGAPYTEPAVMPMSSLAASRAYWWLVDEDEDLAKGLAQAVLHAHWGEGRDMSTVDQVAEVAVPLGVGKSELAAACADPRIKQLLKDETDRSIARGVFGSPFFMIDDEPFWGADRLDQLERWLASGGW
jgi:2-hydroxychromene-2-carboxylate isomerase